MRWVHGLLLVLVGCDGSDPVDLSTGSDSAVDVDAEVRQLLDLPEHFETPYIPSYNPLSAEKIELGRALFFDRNLSGNQTQACVDCHLPELAFSDGVKTFLSFVSILIPRYTPF